MKSAEKSARTAKTEINMTRDEFLEHLQDLLQRDDPLSPEMTLKGLEEWDSLSMMAIAGFFDKHFHINLIFPDFEKFVTVADILDRAGV